MSTKYTGGELPSNPSTWEAAASKYQASSIHELQSAQSASDITVEQFISLKVLWPKRLQQADLSENETAGIFGSSKVDIRKARSDIREQDGAWNAYLEAIAAKSGDGPLGLKLNRNSKFPTELGVYALVLQSQLEALNLEDSLNDSRRLRLSPLSKDEMRGRLRSAKQDPKGKGKEPKSQSQGSTQPSHTSNTSSSARNISPTTHEEALDFPVGDEQIVNTAAINFLNALLIHDARLADWTLQRKQFKFKSASIKFEARTDGHLQVHGHDRSAAILEVKPRVRYAEIGYRIEMQESAQMALWIFQEPNSHWAPPKGGDQYHRVLLSQDRHEIYVTIAAYTANYIAYLQDRVGFEDAEFLRMQSYGPFLTTDDKHMSSLGAVLRKLLPYAATYRPPQQISPSYVPRTPSPPEKHSSDDSLDRRGRAPGPQAERPGISQRRTTSSPLNPRSKNSSPSFFEHEDPGRLLFGRLAISDNPRSSSQSQSPQRPGISGAQEAAPGRTLTPFSSPPRAGHPAVTGGEQSTRPQGGQPGSQRSREQGDKKGKRKK